jgi:hypothetical protein
MGLRRKQVARAGIVVGLALAGPVLLVGGYVLFCVGSIAFLALGAVDRVRNARAFVATGHLAADSNKYRRVFEAWVLDN